MTSTDGDFSWLQTADDQRRVIAHVDMDCFYAACERLREPPLRDEPVVVGMGYEPGETDGAVATASYEAREYGVESAMAISEALELLPRKREAAKRDDLAVEDAGFYRPVDMDYYERISEEVREVLQAAADVVREVSIDEAYLDVTDRVDFEDARAFARELKNEIEREVGVVASVGVAPTMSAAKIASDHDKPDGLVVVEPDEIREFLAPLAVEEIHNVGPVTARELREMGIETAGDLAAADPDALLERFGERGLEIYGYARGEDDREVTPTGRPKSLSRESSFGEATTDADERRERVRLLAEEVADRARREDALYRTIGIKAVTPPFEVHTRARSLPGPVADADLLEEVALDLLGEFEDDPVRKVGVRVSNLEFTDGRQSSLDGFDGADRAEDVEVGETDPADGTGRGDGIDPESPAADSGDPDDDASAGNGQTALTDFEW